MKQQTKVRGGALLLAGVLLFAAAPAPAQHRRPDTKDSNLDARSVSRKAPPPVVQGSKPASEIFFCESPTTECRSTNSTFVVTKLRDLFVFVTWPGVSGDFVQTVEFFLPDGSLYMKRATPFRASRAQVRALAVPGAAPTASEFLTTSRGAPTVITPLAISGTYITQRSLLGTWTVRVSVAGKPVKTAQFTLKAPEQK
ncbi:MAG: hypothetical protein M1453_14170 [Acidobacteria bacterium]|nr:hypothetical protein [Acidobacteriota bacterium]MCL5289126.1 hypothetical protein [Acidobacteriota bacterium]